MKVKGRSKGSKLTAGDTQADRNLIAYVAHMLAPHSTTRSVLPQEGFSPSYLVVVCKKGLLEYHNERQLAINNIESIASKFHIR
jgi:hypothetical protein